MSRRRMPSGREPRPGEVYFEHIRIGVSSKVSAIDAATGVEVTIIGPASADLRMLEAAALRKLKARLARES